MFSIAAQWLARPNFLHSSHPCCGAGAGGTRSRTSSWCQLGLVVGRWLGLEHGCREMERLKLEMAVQLSAIEWGTTSLPPEMPSARDTWLEPSIFQTLQALGELARLHMQLNRLSPCELGGTALGGWGTSLLSLIPSRHTASDHSLPWGASWSGWEAKVV